MKKRHPFKFASIVFVVFFGASFLILPVPRLINASSSVGTIDSVYKYAKGVEHSDVQVNFGFFQGSSGVYVTDTYLSGFAWGQNIGWFNLAPSGGGVMNNGEGLLSGYASSELGGWVNFNGVTINSSGEFTGYANTEKLGKLVFNCVTNNSCATNSFKVKTDWLPISVRNNTSPAPTYITPPITPPPVFSSTINPDTTQSSGNTSLTPAPLPAGGASQYSGGGDVVNNNIPASSNGGAITIVRPPDEPNVPVVPKSPIKPNTTTTSDAVKTVNNISNVVKSTTKKVETVTEMPTVNVTTKAVTTVGVASSGTSLFFSLTGGTFAFSEFSLILLRSWSLLLAALGLRKRKEPWGVVYDSVTKQPLDPAYVILRKKDGEIFSSSITDLDGRFGFLAPAGVYKIFAKKTNYIAPSLHLYGKKDDGPYDNLYFGEEIEIKTDSTITRNIPMDPQGFDWNEFAKRDQKYIKPHYPIKKLFSRVANALFFVGLFLAIVLFIVKPDVYNISILVLYIFFSILHFVRLKTKTFGIITNKLDGTPLPFALIRIYSKSTNTEMFHRTADTAGHYYCLLAKGHYYITIEKKNTDDSYSKVFTSKSFRTGEGILNKDFRV